MESVFKFWKNMEKKTGQLIPMQVFPAVVKEVDKERRTCTVRVNDNVDFYDVRLYAVTDKELKGFCLLPAVDSQVLVARIANGNELYVCSFSVVEKVLGTIGDKVEIAVDKESLSYKCDKTEATIKSNDIQVKTEKVIFSVSDSQVTVKADQVVFNDGEKGGLINIEKLAAYIDGIVENFNGHTHTFKPNAIAVSGNTGSMANAADIISPAPDSKVEKVELKDYEDANVKH